MPFQDVTPDSQLPVDDFDREVALTRSNRELMAFLEERAREPAMVTLEEIQGRLQGV